MILCPNVVVRTFRILTLISPRNKQVRMNMCITAIYMEIHVKTQHHKTMSLNLCYFDIVLPFCCLDSLYLNILYRHNPELIRHLSKLRSVPYCNYDYLTI